MTDKPRWLHCVIIDALADGSVGVRSAHEILDALAEVAAGVLVQAPPPQFAEQMLRFGVTLSTYVQQIRELRASPAADPARAAATLQ